MAGFEREGLVKEKGLSLTPERMTDLRRWKQKKEEADSFRRGRHLRTREPRPPRREDSERESCVDAYEDQAPWPWSWEPPRRPPMAELALRHQLTMWVCTRSIAM